jgi:hypothetical protein
VSDFPTLLALFLTPLVTQEDAERRFSPGERPGFQGVAPALLKTCPLFPAITMFIQKVFHVRLGLEQTKAALKNVDLYGSELEGMRKAALTPEGSAHVECEMPSGLRTNCVISELPSENPNQALFRSTDGNLEVCGLVEFIPIRDQLTEVQLTLDYAFESSIHALIDRITNDTDKFINRLLERIIDWLNCAAFALSGEHAGSFAGSLQLAQ